MPNIKHILNIIRGVLFNLFRSYLNDNLDKIVKETLERGQPSLEQTLSVLHITHDYCERHFNGVLIRQLRELLEKHGFKVTNPEIESNS